MKTLNDYCTYELTEAEDLMSHILSTETYAKLKNIQMSLMLEKGNITLDLNTPNSMEQFIQKQAWQQGQLDLVTTLLLAHEEAVVASSKS